MAGKSRGGAQASSRASSAKAAAAAASLAGGGSASPQPHVAERQTNVLLGLTYVGAALYVSFLALKRAYEIRLLPVVEFGPIIHEFDPYFNYRATEYLYQHGAKKFFTWFDDQVWYPLGRPVGTTIYPGMQFTAVYIKEYLFGDMSINDICVYIPAWFGALQTAAIGLLAYECSLPQSTGLTVFSVLSDVLKGRRTDVPAPPSTWRNLFLGVPSPALECGVAATAIAAILPASLMRSMAGAYDNEAVAVFAMCLSFYFWSRSLRAGGGVPAAALFGSLSGLAYFYLVATWGGYIFALNLVGLHAAVLVVMGRFTTQVYVAYSLFYAVGTALAVRVPVVGWTPLKSLEQLAPCGVFLVYQLLQFCEVKRRAENLSRDAAWRLRKRVFLGAAVAAVVVITAVAPSGYFGPLSSRVRGLFVPHTRTGNPLVDSVAEHQKTQNRVYFQYLHHLCTIAPIGFVTVMFHMGDAPSFLLVYGVAAYYFSAKMNRLVLLTGPIGAVLGGIVIGKVFAWSVGQFLSLLFPSGGSGGSDDDLGKASEAAAMGGKQKGGGKRKKGRKADVSAASKTSFAGFVAIRDSVKTAASSPEGQLAKRALSVFGLLFIYRFSTSLDRKSTVISQSLANPQVVFKGRQGNKEFIVDDYLEAYKWIRDNTPEDSRIMSWWDYGYQINGVANRTTLADGNTWNHEHIALLGKILTGNIDASYAIARHLADYVLVWAGGGGDDVAKSPHLARIANSVYRDHCPDDPTCQMFGRDRNGNPTKMMQDSLLYNLHSYQIRPDAKVDAEKFQEVYKSKYGKVRIFKIMNIAQESKDWVADPANKLCDVPGSWYCPGQYPPALKSVLERKKDFAQLEDFNRGEADDEYQKQYFEGLENPRKVQKKQQQTSAAEEKPGTYPSQGKSDESDQFVAPKSTIPSSDEDSAGVGASKPKMNLPDQGEQSTPIQPRPKPTQEEIDDVYNRWENSEFATLTWQMIKDGEVEKLENWYKVEPLAPFVRSEDGRGPMWWAFENKNQAIVKLLINQGVSHDDTDKYGKVPADLLPSD